MVASSGWSRFPSTLRLPSASLSGNRGSLQVANLLANLLVLTSTMSNSTAPAQPIRVRSTCDVCLDAKVRCSRDRPACRRCLHHGRDCVYSNKRRLGRPRGTTSRPRAASSSTASAGPYTNLSPDETGHPMSTSHMSGNFGAFSNSLPLESISPFAQQQMAPANIGSSEYPFYPTWQAGFDHDASVPAFPAPDSSRSAQVASRLDHVQHANFGGAYTGYDLGSFNIDTNPPPLVHSTSNNGLASHVGSSPESAQDTEYPFSTMLLRPVYSNLDNGQRILLPVMSAGLTPTDTPPTTSATNTHVPAFCSCYSDILQRLSDLKDNNSGVSTSELDQIMELEQDIRIQILAMVRCELCLFERPRALLLVGVVLESVLDLLECACVTDTPINTSEHVRRPPMLTHTSSSGSSSSYNSNHLYEIPTLNATNPNVQYNVCSSEKAAQLRHLVRTRLYEVLGLTRHLHEHVQRCRSWASNFAAADTTMAEIGNRVCALMSRLEG
ncbi:uncharacterized protein RCC_11380 [Ramularia collo-cygni]|uniref:Zn(2)-C6 fungal-type domain-containing protein n=1 Tax=Ramularia collo-cygni TaxID=112498 RepID=A0A2D3V890_9PEZI|nr:uncharacterized protein RCC_11380 [Ramularia collo-cygni]CZT25711.1 uncharacterized protein RCC_11380 [Ramularia collo-cygni]